MRKVVIANSNKKNENQKLILLGVLISVIFFFSFIYDSPTDMDRFENYSIGMFISDMSIKDIITFYYYNGYDFIFYIGLGYFSSFQFGMQFFMGLLTALYYIAIFRYFVKIGGAVTSENVLILIGLVCFPSIIYVVNLSRSVLALFFFALGVKIWASKRYSAHLLFFILSFFTHAATIIFIVFFYSGVLTYFLLRKKPNLTSVLCVILPPFFYLTLRSLFLGILQIGLLGDVLFETKYEHYLSSTGTVNLQISIGALLSIYVEIILSYILINMDREVTLNKILCFVFSTLTFAFLAVNQNVLNRFVVALPIFYSLYFFELFEKSKIKRNRYRIRLNWFTISSLICFFSFSLIIFQERKSFFPFVFN